MQQPSIFRGVLTWLGWLVAGFCLLGMMSLYASKMEYFDTTGGIQEKYHSLSTKHSDNKIAIINATGVIMSGDGFVKRQIDQVLKEMIERCQQLKLRLDRPESKAKLQATILLTVQTMNYLHSGRHRLAL